MKERLNTFICRQLAKASVWVIENDIRSYAKRGMLSPYHRVHLIRLEEYRQYLEQTAKN